MSDEPNEQDENRGGPIKDPDQWVTGDEPMTEAQRAFLQNLSERAEVPFDEQLTKAEASERIDELRGSTGGQASSGGDQADDGPRAVERDPDHWVTGDDPMTEAQRAFLRRLSEQAGEPFDDSLTKAEASKRIDELRERTAGGG